MQKINKANGPTFDDFYPAIHRVQHPQNCAPPQSSLECSAAKYPEINFKIKALENAV